MLRGGGSQCGVEAYDQTRNAHDQRGLSSAVRKALFPGKCELHGRKKNKIRSRIASARYSGYAGRAGEPIGKETVFPHSLREVAMSDSASRARLELCKLDDRLVPSTVAATSTVRPLDFVGTGTLTTTTLNNSGAVPVTSTATTAVTLNGLLDYTSTTQGTAGLVSISGSGTGNEIPVDPASSGGRGSFAQTVQGQLSLTDNNGAIATPTPITGNVNWLTPTGTAGIELIGPHAATGTFDTSTFQLQAGWSTATQTGNIQVALASKTNVQSDLAFGDKIAALALDGSVTLDFTAKITGNLLRAPSHDAAVTGITAVWEGDGQTLAADVNVAINWNTGTVAVHAEGLTPPAWAKSLTVKLDAGAVVSESNETNNSWTVTLADLLPPPPPPPPAPPPPVASFAIVSINGEPMVQFRSASGAIISQMPALEGFKGPVAIKTGDVNGDGIPDVAIAPGEGGGPRVRIVDGKTGNDLANFFAYDSEFRGGVNIALGDLNGNGKLEVITGAGEGGGPHVRVFDAQTGAPISEYFAYDPEARGGVHVATGDLNGDGKAEIITTPGAGEGGLLLVLNGITGAELFSTPVLGSQSTGGAAVSASVDPITHAIVVVSIPDDGSPLLRFRSQLAAGDPLLVAVPNTPILLDPALSV